MQSRVPLGPGKFHVVVLVFLRSVTNRPPVSRAHASLVHAHGTWNLQKLSSWKASSSDSMISTAMKSHTNEHTVRTKGRYAFSERVGLQAYEKSIYERTFWVNWSRIIWIVSYQRSYLNRGYQLFNLIKSIFKYVMVFKDVIVNQVGSQHELITSEQQEQKGWRICFCCLRMYLFEYT